MAVRNIKLTIQYDGTDYHGWQLQRDVPSVQETVSNALEKLIGDEVRVTGASRTDAGVHAAGQVANIQVDSPIPTDHFVDALNNLLPQDIVIVEAVDVPVPFNAITSARRKFYRYTIYTGHLRPVFDIRTCWHYPYSLNIPTMDKAAQVLVGTHDFRSFAASADQRQSSVRTIFYCRVTGDGPWIWVDVEGDGFLYNMVRNITGTLVEIGRGHWPPEMMAEILDARDRRCAGPIAPPSGLCLMRIDYEDNGATEMAPDQ